MSAHRPDPDELLGRIQAEEAAQKRGRLKIFLGYAPRTGKSVRMFEEGLRRKNRGQDVVLGAIQASGSESLTDVIQQFETIPLRDGAADLQSILQRRPEVCLIDELASENPPGAQNSHRWKDVETLRDAGIHVVGAINLQHIAEQQDAVERSTGKRAVTSVPERFIHNADELVIVDAPEGEVNNQLRELALLLTAQVVEEQLQRYMDAHGIQQSWGTQERILICITARSNTKRMVEWAARAVKRFHGQMLAVHVKRGELPADNLEYARRLGAEVHVIEGSDATEAILRFAREQRITQIFIGHTQQPRWKLWARNSVTRLIQGANGIDVRIFPQEATRAAN